MNVVKPNNVMRAINTLSPEERNRVFAWIRQLENWENDEFVRQLAKPMIYKDTYVLNTSDDLRIFFTMTAGSDQITIVDVAKPSRFAAAGVPLG